VTVGFPWISLDSLVRIEPFQWVTRLFRKKKILSPLFAAEAPERGARPLLIQTADIAHPASLALVLIFCNRLLSDPSHFGRPTQTGSAFYGVSVGAFSPFLF
jgi:hypothetical protein